MNRWVNAMSAAKLTVLAASLIGVFWVFGGLGLDVSCASGGIASDRIFDRDPTPAPPVPTPVPEPTPVSVGRLALEEAMDNMAEKSSFRFEIETIGSSVSSEGYVIGRNRMAARFWLGDSFIGALARFGDDYYFTPAPPLLESASDESEESSESMESPDFGEIRDWSAIDDKSVLSSLLPVDPGLLLSDSALFLASTDSEYTEDANRVEWLLSGLLSAEFVSRAATGESFALGPTQFHLKSSQIGRRFLPTFLRIYGQRDVKIEISDLGLPLDDIVRRPAEPWETRDAETRARIASAISAAIAALSERSVESAREDSPAAVDSASKLADLARPPELPAGFSSAFTESPGWRRYGSEHIGASVEIPSALSATAKTWPAEPTVGRDGEGEFEMGPFREVSASLEFDDPFGEGGTRVRLSSRSSADALSLSEAVESFLIQRAEDFGKGHRVELFAQPNFSGALIVALSEPDDVEDSPEDASLRVYLFEVAPSAFAELELESVSSAVAERIVASLSPVELIFEPPGR